MMKQLIPANTGGGLKRSKTPTAVLNDNGALTLNLAADALIGGDKWLVWYEDNPALPPKIELKAASASDRAGYVVTRSGGSAAKITIRTLLSDATNADHYIGRWTVQRMAGGLRLTRTEDPHHDN